MEIKLLGITVCSVRTHLYIQFSYQSTIKKTIVKKQNTSKKHAIFVCFAQRRCQNHLTTMVATYRQGEQGVVLKYYYVKGNGLLMLIRDQKSMR